MNKWAIRLVVIAMMLCLCAIMLGGLQAPHSLLADFDLRCEAEAHPCWQGMVPEVTTIDAARTVVEALGYEPDNTSIELSDRVFVYRTAARSPEWVDLYYLPASGVVESVVLRSTGVRVGDLMAIAGAPARSWGASGVREILYYPGKFLAIVNYGRKPFSIYTPVDAIYVEAGVSNLPHSSTAIGWHGFAPLWRYCQLEAGNPLCRAEG